MGMTSLNGFQTISRVELSAPDQRLVTFPLLSLPTQRHLKESSNVLLPNSVLCTGEKLSCIGTRVKAWTRWNSKKQTRTSEILSLNTKISRMLLTKRRKKKKMKTSELFARLKGCRKLREIFRNYARRGGVLTNNLVVFGFSLWWIVDLLTSITHWFLLIYSVNETIFS